MKGFKQALAGMALLIAISAPVVAQTAAGGGAGRGGQGQGRGGRGRVSAGTLPIGTLSYILKLKDEQKTKVEAVQTKLKEDLKTATGDRPKIMELNMKAAADIDAILDEDQKKMLKEAIPILQLVQQSRAMPLAVIPELKVTKEQHVKILELAKDINDKIAALPQADRQTGRPPLVAEFKTKLEAILTDEQKKTIVEKTPKPAAKPNPAP